VALRWSSPAAMDGGAAVVSGGGKAADEGRRGEARQMVSSAWPGQARGGGGRRLEVAWLAATPARNWAAWGRDRVRGKRGMERGRRGLYRGGLG
jgi:hypothetical protein